MTKGKRSRCFPSSPTDARTSSARTSPAVRQALVVWRRHVRGERRPYGYSNVIDITDETNPKNRLQDHARSARPRELREIPQLSRQKSAAGSSTIPPKDAPWTVRRIRRWPLAAREVQAPGSTTFAILSTLQRSRTGRGRLRGRLSFPDQVAGGRVSIEPSKSKLVWRAFVKVPAADGKGHELNLWIVGDGSGFQVLRFTNAFKALHKDLMAESVRSK